MNRRELNNFFNRQIDEYSKLDARIGALKEKVAEVNSMENDSMIQINMGLCIFSISKESALTMLTEAVAVEQEYHHMMYQRFDRAVGVLNGE